MAADPIQQDQPSTQIARERRWLEPRVTRFGAAGAAAGSNLTNNEDGDTSKS